MLNLSSLFHSSVEQPTLLEELDLTEAQLAIVSEARTAIRNCLRENLPKALGKAGHNIVVRPRFFTQGSYAYKTLNGPAQPPQQADIDDGAYLPLSFVSATGKPSVAAAVFFLATEQVLSVLAAQRGWHLITDKPTCVRVQVATFAHVDIPLYAIPDTEFHTLKEARAARSMVGGDLSEHMDSEDTDVWEKLPKDSVLLAHREHDWMKSDPRPVREWFLNEVKEQGEQLRRVVRYTKAFRDWRWPSGGPSSILLMAAVALVFDSRERRDDLALLHVVERLPRTLRAGVVNPTASDESLTDRAGEDCVEDTAIAFEELAVALKSALSDLPEKACERMRAHLGNRFPCEPLRVKRDTVEERVRAIPPQQVATPLVGRTRSA
jgi:hypothetical protein